ncbi:uncharacterized protein PAN0_004c2151 [Moesziomyces antarcticus]|uniref:Uncharacterized protein n=2 Tax=Pseudozyma antarctica TaxID=84753 RepID=A0A081CB96_PSEA2|nr:uncharacterized protein PAN0_004c2151 [Moesziomyces antarcticus]GAK63942.1 hypothetical protein PAN0_004c2151 [Moesziomyces antarcticus]SPO44847.1 uncharacterized protein PSANT_02533 [Moesziomyces antarcticus]
MVTRRILPSCPALVEPRDSVQVPFTPVALLTDNALTGFYDYATSNFQSMMYRSHYTHPRGRAPTLEEGRDPLHSFAPWSSLPLPIESLRGLGLVQPRGTIQMPFVPVDLLTNNAIRELYEEITRILQRTINQIHFFLSDGRVPTYEEVQDNFITYMQSTYEAFGFTGDPAPKPKHVTTDVDVRHAESARLSLSVDEYELSAEKHRYDYFGPRCLRLAAARILSRRAPVTSSSSGRRSEQDRGEQDKHRQIPHPLGYVASHTSQVLIHGDASCSRTFNLTSARPRLPLLLLCSSSVTSALSSYFLTTTLFILHLESLVAQPLALIS